MIVFYHMIKTAGMTFSYILRNNFAYNHVSVIPIYQKLDSLGNEVFTAEDLSVYKKLNPCIRAISSHYLKPHSFESIDGNFGLTFLRDPVKRFLSSYHHATREGYIKMSLMERMENPDEQNYQTKFIAGEENLEKAKLILQKKIDFVGLVEEYDLSLLVIRSMLENKLNIYYEKRNVGKKYKEEIPPETLRKIQESNQLDIELVRFARENIFKNQVDKYLSDPEKELRDFQEKNKQQKFSPVRINLYRFAHHLYFKQSARVLRLLV